MTPLVSVLFKLGNTWEFIDDGDDMNDNLRLGYPEAISADGVIKKLGELYATPTSCTKY